MMALARHDWPGNVRELQNVIERAVVMTTGRVLCRHTATCLEPADSPPHCVSSISDRPVLKTARIRTLADAERAHINAVLHETNGLIGGPRGAAARLGVPRTTLIGKMQRLGISNCAIRDRSAHSARGLVGISEVVSSNPGKGAADSLNAIEMAAG